LAWGAGILNIMHLLWLSSHGVRRNINFLFAFHSSLHIINRLQPGNVMSKASERSYQQIRDMVLKGVLKPGDQLKEEELALQCGVSRTPVRDALQRLETEFFVIRENGRCYVPEWSMEDMEDLFSLRAMLEGYAAARAAERLTPANLERLRKYHVGIGIAIGVDKPKNTKADIETFLHHNREFHRIILEAAGSLRLATLLSKLIEQPIVMRTAFSYDHDDLVRSHNQHGELLASLESRDPVWARAVMTAHIQRALHVFNETQSRVTARSRRRRAE
jgi:DNA-binding GntR family transcriptional regulator